MAVALLVIGFFYLDLAYTVESVLVVGLFDLVAIIMNVVWLILYWSNFWGGDYIDSGSLDGNRRWLIILTFVMLGIEVVLLFLLSRIFWFVKKRTTGSLPYNNQMQVQGGPSAFGGVYQQNFYRPGSIDYYQNFRTDGFFIERPMGYQQRAPGQAAMGVPTSAPTSGANPMPIAQPGTGPVPVTGPQTPPGPAGPVPTLALPPRT
jgi:hypothetical protein